MIKSFMEKLQDETGQTFSTQDPGTYQIPINDSLNIIIHDRNRGFLLESILGEPPYLHEDEFFSDAMQGNLYGQNTSGAILSQTTDGKFLKINYEGQDPSDYRRFRQIIEDFWDAAVVWQEELQNANSQK